MTGDDYAWVATALYFGWLCKRIGFQAIHSSANQHYRRCLAVELSSAAYSDCETHRRHVVCMGIRLHAPSGRLRLQQFLRREVLSRHAGRLHLTCLGFTDFDAVDS